MNDLAFSGMVLIFQECSEFLRTVPSGKFKSLKNLQLSEEHSYSSETFINPETPS
jgi:hypothetical protein